MHENQTKRVGYPRHDDFLMEVIAMPFRLASLNSVAPRMHERQRLKLIRAASSQFAAANLRAQKAAAVAASIVTPYFQQFHISVLSVSIRVIMFFVISFMLLRPECIDRIITFRYGLYPECRGAALLSRYQKAIPVMRRLVRTKVIMSITTFLELSVTAIIHGPKLVREFAIIFSEAFYNFVSRGNLLTRGVNLYWNGVYVFS